MRLRGRKQGRIITELETFSTSRGARVTKKKALSCNACYIGETTRHICTRVREQLVIMYTVKLQMFNRRTFATEDMPELVVMRISNAVLSLRARRLKKETVCIRVKWHHQAGTYLRFHRVTPGIKFAGTHLYTWVERGTARLKCLAQEHNTMSPARTRTQTTGERTNREATAFETGL